MSINFFRLNAFRSDARATVTILSAVCMPPLIFSCGVAVDYGRTAQAQAQMQTAIDAAVLAGSQLAANGRVAYSTNFFQSQTPKIDGAVNTPTFATNGDGSFSGVATASVNTKLASIFGVATMAVTARSKASRPVAEQACILTYGNNIATTTNTLTFNGAPSVNLQGCDLYSNDSLICNGQPTNAPHSYAVGTSAGCNNPISGAAEIPDIYAPIAANLTKECSTNAYANLTWTPSAMPPSPKVITVSKTDRTEYHVCGTLTLSGSGALFNTSTSADTLIVVENGALILDDTAAINAQRTTFAITATNTSASHIVDFPNGNGHAASLTVSPSKTSTNPWRGMALYQDPALTTNVNMTWGPGASVYIDGVIYFPNASLTMHGAGNSNASGCTKIAVNSFTNNGNFNLSQSTSACDDINMRQYVAASRLIN